MVISNQTLTYIERAITAFNNPFINTRKSSYFSDSQNPLCFYAKGKYRAPSNAVFQQTRVLQKNTLISIRRLFNENYAINSQITTFKKRHISIIQNSTLQIKTKDIEKFFKIKKINYNDERKKKKINVLTKLYQMNLINSLFCDDIGVSINRIKIFEENENLCFFRLIPVSNKNFMKVFVEKTTIKFLKKSFARQKKFNNFLEYKNRIKYILEQYNGGIYGVELKYIIGHDEIKSQVFHQYEKVETDYFALTTETSENQFMIFYPNYRKDKNEFIPNWKEIQKMEDYLSMININLEQILIKNWRNHITSLCFRRPVSLI